MRPDLYLESDYKSYLIKWLAHPELGAGRGARTRLAKAIQCESPYVAQVLNGSAHFSLEQAELTNLFLGHTEEQAQFFLLLVQHDRTGLLSLKARFEKQLIAIREKRKFLKERLNVEQTISREDQSTFYSSWYYAAIHALLSIPSLASPKEIAKHLNLDSGLVIDVLEFLVKSNMVLETNGKYTIRSARSHLGSDSNLIIKHHTNWRFQAIRAMELSNKHEENLHYSSIVTVSEKDVARIRELITQFIEQAKAIIKESPEERLQSLCIDFFKI